jgi:hypothetical protein
MRLGKVTVVQRTSQNGSDQRLETISVPYNYKVHMHPPVGAYFTNTQFICKRTHILRAHTKPVILRIGYETERGRSHSVCSADAFFDR